MCLLIGLDADFTDLTSTFLDLSALLLEDGRLFGWTGESSWLHDAILCTHALKTQVCLLKWIKKKKKQRLDHKPVRRRAATNEPFYQNFSRPLMRARCVGLVAWQRLVRFHTHTVKTKHTSRVKGRKRRIAVFNLCISLDEHSTRLRRLKKVT